MSQLPRPAGLVLVVAVLTLLTACDAQDLPGTVDDAAEGLRRAVEDAGEKIQDLARRAEEQIGGQPAEPGAPADGGDAQPAVEVPDDTGALGSACRAYLRDDIPAMAVEVTYQAGAAPASGAVDHLVATLREVTDKPAGVELIGPSRVPGEGRTWTAGELRAFASQHRTQRSSVDRVAMQVLAVRGEFEQQGVLGVALNATQLAIFPERMGDLGTALLGVLGGRETIERAVLVHEAGHLLCLVNIGYESERAHADPDHPRHSIHESSVMHWAIETDAISRIFSGPPPTEFHPDDLADLQALREGRY